ncbi:MAG: branched-chain amino acid ABC transporter permease [Burkholderiaceae bacterium]|nr:branched-chain amino acid ABC transporter permease [Burkholderiaceae bacterium]
MQGLIATYGLNLGYQLAVVALVVLGLGIVFGMLGIMNMAHGEFVMLGAYSAVAVQQAGLPLPLALPLAILVCATVGWVTERLLIRPLSDRPFDTLLATWGLGILLRKAVEAIYGRGYQSIEHGLTGTSHVLGTDYPTYRLALMSLIAALLVALVVWYRRSPAGARVRAMVANPALAQALGMDVGAMARNAFVLGVVLAGLAGVLLAPLVRIEPNMGLDYLLGSFFVLVVGGLGSLSGLFAGTGVVGGTQVLVASLADQTWGYLAVLTISIGFLWLRPHGLVGRR